MKTFYSILYIPISATLDEKVSIGLIMSNGSQNLFKYSQSKLQAIKLLLDNESYNILKVYLRSLEKEINDEIEKEYTLRIKYADSKTNWINNSYITYLSKYSNNLIKFSEPYLIDVLLNRDVFKRVFEKYIFPFDEIISTSSEPTIYQKIKSKLYPKIQGKVNIDKTITSDDLENLFAPVEVNFIGLNGNPVAGLTVDFEKKHYFLENDITRFVSLSKALELSGKPNGKYFILGKEPNVNKTDKNHIMWTQIRDTKFLEFVDIDEFGIIEDYIDKNHVSPFFKDLSE
jgi:hypothetical protein